MRELLQTIRLQALNNLSCEIVVVDSGSTDNTLQIAEEFDCRITHIRKEDFSFGRSLNLGSDFADGEYLVYVSGHCIPTSEHWLEQLIKPLTDGIAGYSYGRQVGRDTTKFSEEELFYKYFPEVSEVPQSGFFCNNANAAISRKVWAQYRFDEQITGLEDMELAKRFVGSGGAIAYIAEAAVYHIHNESWRQTRRRYEREAVALQVVMPELRVTRLDMWRYIFAAVFADFRRAAEKRRLLANWMQIIKFRTAQYFGSHRGNKLVKQAADERREAYFYPKESFRQ